MDNEYIDQRTTPQNELDLNLMLINNMWGSNEVPQELKEKLNQYSYGLDENGNTIINKASLWSILRIYTRDLRLANLSSFDNELVVCRYYLELANDLLLNNNIEPFMISLSRAITILETSQSKGGFLRRMFNTLRQENVTQNMDAPKKSLFGGGLNKGG